MADDNQTPVFQIQRVYLKDLSLEQPNSPQILLEQGQPQVEINLALGANPIAEGVYEVTVTATVTTKVNDKVLFLVEAKQGGIFEIRNIPEDQLQADHRHRVPGHHLPLPARDRLRCLHARRLPAGAAVGSQFPGDVRGPASAAGTERCARRRDQWSDQRRSERLDDHHLVELICGLLAGRDEPHGPRCRRLGHRARGQRRRSAPDAAVGA